MRSTHIAEAETFRLAADERPIYCHVFYATGHGHFPLDMLRHDRAFPADSESADEIAPTDLRYRMAGSHQRQRTVKLISHAYRLAPERWHSFGWEISREPPAAE